MAVGVSGAVGRGVIEGRGVSEGRGVAVCVATGVGVSVAVAVASGVGVSASVGEALGVAVGDCTAKLQPVRTSAHPANVSIPSRITRTNPLSFHQPGNRYTLRSAHSATTVILTDPVHDAQSHLGSWACVFLST